MSSLVRDATIKLGMLFFLFVAGLEIDITARLGSGSSPFQGSLS